MRKRSTPSAGLLAYRTAGGELEILLAHPGGPFWTRKDDGVWIVPKRKLNAGEAPDEAARREFLEETRFASPASFARLALFVRRAASSFMDMLSKRTEIPQVCAATRLTSNGRRGPGGQWRSPRSTALHGLPPRVREKINPAQIPFCDQLVALTGVSPDI